MSRNARLPIEGYRQCGIVFEIILNNNCCTADNKDFFKNQIFYLFHLPEMQN